MKRKLLIQTTILLLAVTGLTGCKNGRWFWQKAPATAGAGAGTETSVPPLGGTDIVAGERPMAAGDWQRGQFQPVYFDYDSATVKPGELSKLQAVVTALRGNSKRVIIEGHCDERGTAEYNRALGERRAQAARAELIQLGVDPSRITTSSFGKERPADFGHDEAAWAKNRRCEFVLAN